MDRLYSRFPAGSVGLALLLLRLVDGLGLVRVGIHVFTPTGTSESASALLLGSVLVASALLLILGLRTPLARQEAPCTPAST